MLSLITPRISLPVLAIILSSVAIFLQFTAGGFVECAGADAPCDAGVNITVDGTSTFNNDQDAAGDLTWKSLSNATAFVCDADGEDCTLQIPVILTDLTATTATVTTMTITTADINGGTIDSVTIGGVTPGAGTFTSLNATGGGALTGTWSNLGSVTTIDINGGTIDGATIGGVTPGAGSFTTVTTSSFLDLQNNELRNIGNAGTDITASVATFAQDVVADSNLSVGDALNTAGLTNGIEISSGSITGAPGSNQTVIRAQRTTSITTTTPTTIFTSGANASCYVVVRGRQLSTSDEFTDLVLFSETTSFDISNGNNDIGTPETRTYTTSSNSLQVTFGSAPAAEWRLLTSGMCVGDTL